MTKALDNTQVHRVAIGCWVEELILVSSDLPSTRRVDIVSVLWLCGETDLGDKHNHQLAALSLDGLE